MKMFRKIVFGAAVASLMAAGDASAAGNKLVLDGSTTVGPIAKAFAAYFTKKYHVEVTVSESGSGNGAKSLINKTCDIADMSRPMKENELSAAKANGVNPVQNIVALDGMAMIVHPSNRVKALTKDQIREIYTGKITNWSQVGGPNAAIVIIQRESNSGTQGSFKDLVMNEEPIAQGAETQASNGAVKSRVATTPTAIGFVGLGFVDRSVKVVAVDGIKPSVQTVKNGKYGISRPLFMYTNGKPAGIVKQFIDIPKSAEGKKIISEVGFVNKY
ncbi:MAG: phosphate ABC transporter substrate-binding protein [Chlorobaculum sp.]|nr:phosphate ABC transporter substrate-binding protein [Chlorobaculum sp.]